MKAQPDATAKKLRERLGILCAESAIFVATKKLGLSFNKKTTHAAEEDRPDVADRRSAWRSDQGGLDPAPLIFIDETRAKINTTRLRGRSPRGVHLVHKVPHGHWKTGTLISALGLSGIRCSTVLDGAVNRDAFEAFVSSRFCCLSSGQGTSWCWTTSPATRTRAH